MTPFLQSGDSLKIVLETEFTSPSFANLDTEVDYAAWKVSGPALLSGTSTETTAREPGV